MEQLFDDLEDFGSFDDAVSGDVRDPYTELARLRREEPVQRLETSGRFLMRSHNLSSSSTATRMPSRCCAITRRSRRRPSSRLSAQYWAKA